PRHSVVEGRFLRARKANHQVADPNEHQVGMVDVEVLPIAGDDAQRREGFLAQALLDGFWAEHVLPSGGGTNASYQRPHVPPTPPPHPSSPVLIAAHCSGVYSTSRALEPLYAPTMPSSAMKSTSRAARP